MMTLTELKEKIIAQINIVDNEFLLREISAMLDVEASSINGIYQMSAAEIEAVEEGIWQIENGEGISHEEANRQIKDRLRNINFES